MFHVDVSFPTLEILLSSLMIFGLRVSDVSLATFRILMITRGRTRLAATLGFGEAAIWVVAISQVITHVGNLWNMIAYASGFAAGTLFGWKKTSDEALKKNFMWPIGVTVACPRHGNATTKANEITTARRSMLQVSRSCAWDTTMPSWSIASPCANRWQPTPRHRRRTSSRPAAWPRDQAVVSPT